MMRRVGLVLWVVCGCLSLHSAAWAEPTPTVTETITETATPTATPTVTETQTATATATATATPPPAVVDAARAMDEGLTGVQLLYVVLGGVGVALLGFLAVGVMS